jgi:hypothetical protein
MFGRSDETFEGSHVERVREIRGKPKVSAETVRSDDQHRKSN